MDIFTSAAIGFIALLVIIWYNRRQNSSSHPPPGPKPLPLLQNLLSVDVYKLHISFAKLAEQYGRIFKVSLFGEQIVVINDIDMLRKAFLEEDYMDIFAGRPDHFTATYIFFNSDIGFETYNKRTITLRKILQKGFKVFGEGVARFEYQMTEELDRFLAEIKSTNAEDFDISPLFKKSFANWMSALLTGTIAHVDDAEIVWDFDDSLNVLLSPGLNAVLARFPFLRNLPGKPGRLYRTCRTARDRLLRRFLCLDSTESKTDHSGLLEELIQMQEEENKRAGYDVTGDLRGVILDIFFAGVDSTMTALTNIFALLLKYPECSKKIVAEIDSIIGKSRAPSLDDRSHMPYTKAVILEAHRYTAEAPLTLPHTCTKDIVFEGYDIKKDSTVFANLWYIHHDEKVWGDPWSFRPERFLNSSGELLSADHDLRKAWVPFSIGRRACPGETLAMSRTFLYLASILQKFELKPPSSGRVPNVDPRCYAPGITIRVGNYLCQMLPRDASD